MSVIALDTETTGLDIKHGAKPYIVTLSYGEENVWWEWRVNPHTRKPRIPLGDKREIERRVLEADKVILQNAKFDISALASIGILRGRWPWDKTEDTLLSGHLLASNQPHDLTTMTLVYLGYNVKPYEDRMKEVVREAITLAARKDWAVASKDRADMPSAKGRGSLWKFDCWIPRELALAGEGKESWKTVTAEYANSDSTVTRALWFAHQAEIRERGLEKIYRERLRLLPIVHAMQEGGITLHDGRRDQLEKEYLETSERLGGICRGIARRKQYNLTLPKSGNNKSLLDFVFGRLGLEPVKRSKKTGAPSLDAKTLDHYIASLEEDSQERRFVEALREKRKRDTALSYLAAYKRFRVPGEGGWSRLYPSVNPTGTDTLRWASSNPNEQNISKKKGFNLRRCFGPGPGREWWSLDAKNIELRIPAYEAGEEEMVALFENPDKPPYFGSYHLLIFDTLHPDLFAKHGKACKEVYASTWYQWTKNGNFAVQYGAVEESGTADAAYHVPGAQRRIQNRFRRVKALGDRLIALAEKQGYVETIPDRSVDPERGYPIYCTRTRWGGIKPTVPLNYHVQSTAMWWMSRAMVRVFAYLQELGPEYKLVLQVHDELVFDFPKRKLSSFDPPKGGNVPKLRKIKRLMEAGGNDLGFPTPVSVTYHENNWSEGRVLTL